MRKTNPKPERAKIGDTVKIVGDEGNPDWVEIGRTFVIFNMHKYGECPIAGCADGDHVMVRDESADDDIYLHDNEYEIIRTAEPPKPRGKSWVDYIRRR